MPDHTTAVQNAQPLKPTAFVRLPFGSVRPQGWLKRQLDLQSAGLTGSAEQLYDAIGPNSGWLGGGGEGWEKAPYYVRGLIALAYTLDDAALEDRAKKWIDWVLQSQRPDGSFGPASNDDWWPRMIVLSYLRDYYEASGDPRVMPFLLNYFRYQLKELPTRHLRDWGRARGGDNIDVVLWTYNRTGETSLIDLAKLLHEQTYPWSKIFSQNRFYSYGADFQPHHIVNVNQAMKYSPVVWQLTQDPIDRGALALGLGHLNRQYGRIDGEISGTEQLSGLKSTDGVELCADIERIISNGVAVDILGDATLADDMEKVAYNSLPAHTTARMQQMTYYQLLNQVSASIGGHGFQQDYPNGIVPGPYSGFPCCCYNWHAGWPKFVQNMWAATSDGGLALIAYGPNRFSGTVAGKTPITITQTTDYPFDGAVTLSIEPEHPAKFPLMVRVPRWCDAPQISVNGQPVDALRAATFKRIDREWKSGDIVKMNFPMNVVRSTYNAMAGVERGPLAFSLVIGEQWKSIHSYLGGFDEYEVTPTSPWNYALANGGPTADFTVQTQPISQVPFDTAAPPVTLTTTARRVPSWGLRATRGTVVFGKADHHWTPLQEVPSQSNANGSHHLRVQAQGKFVRVFVDDMENPRLVHDDETFSAGAIGLRAYGTSADFSNVKINGSAVLPALKPFSGQWTTQPPASGATQGSIHVDPAKDAKALFEKPASIREITFEATVTVAPGGDAGVIFRCEQLTADLDGYRGYYVGIGSKGGGEQDADEPPKTPVMSNQPLETIKLIPFGSTKLRISYFPVLAGSKQAN